MKHIKYFMLSFMMIFLAGCGKIEIDPREKMPTMSELQNYFYSHTQEEYDDKVREIKNIINATPYQELCNILTESFREWEKLKKPLIGAVFSINFSKDDLLMNEQGSGRLYNNLFVEVEVSYDKDKNKKSNINLLNEQINEVLRKTPYGSYKINSITINYYDKNGDSDKSFVTGEKINFYLNNDLLTVEQTEDEKNIQTLVYQYAKEWSHEEFGDSQDSCGEIKLKRFGIEKDGRDLYMEILIDSLPPDVDKKTFFNTLEGKGEDLFKHVMSNNESAKYLSGLEVECVEVTFHTPWGSDYEHENDYHVYKYFITDGFVK